MHQLLLITGSRAGTRVEFGAESIFIGRSAECGLRLHDDRASRVHASVRLDPTKGGAASMAGQATPAMVLEDLGSRNGTLLNGVLITAPCVLRPGDLIQVGHTQIVFDGSLALSPARFTGGLLLLDDEVSIKKSLHSSGLGTPELPPPEQLLPLLQARTLPAASVALVVAAQRIVQARGVFLVRSSGGSLQLEAAVGQERLALPPAWLLERLREGRCESAQLDPLGSALLGRLGGDALPKAIICAPFTLRDGQGAALLATAPSVSAAERMSLLARWVALFGSASLSAACAELGERSRRIWRRRDAEEAGPRFVTTSAVLKEQVERARVEALGGRGLRLVGAEGSGRHHLAEQLHQLAGKTGAQTLLRLGPESGLESLIGSESGASTPTLGVLENALGGSCVLASVGKAPRALQAALVEFLETGHLLRVHGQRPVRVQTLVILIDAPGDALPRALERRLKQLSLLRLELPSLRERLEDLPALFDHFLSQVSRGRVDRPLLSEESMLALGRLPWEGNLRELSALARWMASRPNWPTTLALPSLAGEAALELRSTQATEAGGARAEASPSLAEQVHQLERRLIKQAWAQEGGKKSKVAKRLGISRPTLDRKLAKLDFGDP